MADTMTLIQPPDAPAPTGSPTLPAATPSPTPAAPAAPADWTASLPDDLKASPSLTKFKDAASAARAYVELEKFQGRAVVIPGADATPEVRAAFWTKVGAHDAPAKYVVPVPEGQTLDPGLATPFQQAAHRAGLTQDQWAAMLSAYQASPLGNPGMAHEALHREAETSLKAEWGGAYDYNLALAQRGAKQIGGPEVVAVLNSSGLGNHPAFIRLFQRLGKDYAEDGEIVVDATSGAVLGPAAAQTRIQEIQRDRAHPYHRREAPGHDDAVAEMFRLHQVVSEGL